MPGSIQSIERAAAILRTLAISPVPLRLSQIATALQLPRGTVHGLLSTLCDVGFAGQDQATGRYHLGVQLAALDAEQLDGNELRARSMNWADPLAARTGEAVRIGLLDGDGVLVVHYVFRPDPAPQQADVGAVLPAHATALGKALLAYSPGVAARVGARELVSYTARTITRPAALTAELTRARNQGFAVEFGEHAPDQASIAAPIFRSGGYAVGAVAVHGDLDRLCDPAGAPKARMLTQLRDCARNISREFTGHRATG